mmetsp:Transcript_32398/g.91803  ORF Transcript_32398/g.91803 Transcript_32398/m.91803 type:complete len:202 (-) Transcript_32398:1106-1711(-)
MRFCGRPQLSVTSAAFSSCVIWWAGGRGGGPEPSIMTIQHPARAGLLAPLPSHLMNCGVQSTSPVPPSQAKSQGHALKALSAALADPNTAYTRRFLETLPLSEKLCGGLRQPSNRALMSSRSTAFPMECTISWQRSPSSTMVSGGGSRGDAPFLRSHRTSSIATCASSTESCVAASPCRMSLLRTVLARWARLGEARGSPW